MQGLLICVLLSVSRMYTSELCSAADKAWLGIFISAALEKEKKESGTKKQTLRALPNIVEVLLKS